MNRIVASGALGLVAVLAAGSLARAEPTVSLVLDGNDTGKVFQGIGAVSSGGTSRLLYDYPEPQRSQVLDYLFKPGYGAALQELTVEIGGDANSGSGSEASHLHSRGEPDFTVGYEWWLMGEAKQRNRDIRFTAVQESIPGWVGNGDAHSPDNAYYLDVWRKGALRKGFRVDIQPPGGGPKLVTGTYDNLRPANGLLRANEPWSGRYEVQLPVWATAHTTQFAAPGWRYLDKATKPLPRGGSVTALRNGRDYSVVFDLRGASAAQTVKTTVDGGLTASGAVRVWKSAGTDWFVRQPDVAVNGGYQLTLEPGAMYSVTTTTGQRKGDAVSPGSGAFPERYRDDFEAGQRGQQPKYLAQVSGSFEVTPCVGRAGQCVQQVVGEQPNERIQAYPVSFLGEGWADASVEVSFRHELEGAAELWGRIGDATAKLPDGYYLSVQKTGRWYLGKAVRGERRQLKAGFVELPANRWHTAKISFSGTSITVFIDGKQLDTADDSTYARGRAGIGTGWNRVQFDDFAVTGA